MEDDLKELIGRLRRQGRTIDEIRSALADLDVDIPRSTLGRHTKEIDALAATLQQGQEMACALLERLDADPEKASAISRMNSALANGVMFKLLMAQQGEAATLDPKEAKFLMEAHAKLVGADKAMAETVGRARREWQAEQKAKMDELGRDIVGGRKSLTLEEVQKSILDIYGA